MQQPSNYPSHNHIHIHTHPPFKAPLPCLLTNPHSTLKHKSQPETLTEPSRLQRSSRYSRQARREPKEPITEVYGLGERLGRVAGAAGFQALSVRAAERKKERDRETRVLFGHAAPLLSPDPAPSRPAEKLSRCAFLRHGRTSSPRLY